jgi:hypothetical protein
MRRVLIALAFALAVPVCAAAKERATFLAGQYPTAEQCEKLRKVEAGGPRNVGTAPELLDADGFHGWEGGCEFAKVFEHEPGQTWLALMVCSEGLSVTPASYVSSRTRPRTSSRSTAPAIRTAPRFTHAATPGRETRT